MDSWRRAPTWPLCGRVFTHVYSVPHLNTFQDDIPEGTAQDPSCIRARTVPNGPQGPWPFARSRLGRKGAAAWPECHLLSRGPGWSLPRWANGPLSRAKEAVEKLVPCLGWRVVTRVAAGGTV